MHPRRPSIRHCNRRTGLAPLEMVLALPLLLFVTALIVNFADSARWKIRAQANVNYASTRSLGFRSGNADPNPVSWPPPATLSGGRTANNYNINSTNPYWDQIPDINHTILLQPHTAIPYRPPHYYGQQIVVQRGTNPNDPELEMHEGVNRGNARITRRYAQAWKLMPKRGRYEYNLSRQILDADWNFADMAYWSNTDRRARLWYRIEPNDVAPVENRTVVAAQTKLKNEFSDPERRIYHTRITPLDYDYEFCIYSHYSIIPNFHPAPYVNRNAVYKTPGFFGFPMYMLPFDMWPENYGFAHPSNGKVIHVGPFRNYLRQIQRLPGVMAQRFISLYRNEIERQKKGKIPPPGGEPWNVLQQKVEQLQNFQKYLKQHFPESL